MTRPSLPRPIKGLLRPDRPPTHATELWANVAARRARLRDTRGRRLGLRLGAAAFVLGAAALSLLVTLRSPAGPLMLRDGRPVPSRLSPGGQARALSFDDGSRVVVAAGGTLDLLESSERVFRLALRAGRARFEVRPGGPRSWRVDCGPVVVEVVGTAFTLERETEALQVSVKRGAVLVRGERVPDQVQRLGPGDALTVALVAPAQPRDAGPTTGAVTAPDAGIPAVAPPPADNVRKPQPTPAARPTPAAQQIPAVEPMPAWRAASRAGDFARAFSLLQASGLSREVERAQGAEALLELADIARLSGHPAAAIAPLQRLVAEHHKSPQAALGAFTLGRLRMDTLGDAIAAAQDFELAIAMGLPSALSEDAHARAVEAFARAGDAAEARRAADRYRGAFPDGRRRAKVDALSPALAPGP